MKHLKYIFLFLVGIAGFSCSDLEEEPVGLLAPEGFFTSPQDVQTAVNGCYGNMAEEAFWGRKFSLPLMLRSDMVGIGDQGTAQRRKDHDNFMLTDDNGMISVFWPRTYQIIAGANEAISGAKQVNASEDVLNPVLAQAHFVRAFTYFHLVRLFGDLPYLDEPVTDLIAATEIDKTSEAEVYANIIADLEFAKTWLPDQQPYRSMPSKATAQSYLALVYLTLGDYTNAYNEAKAVIDNEGSYDLALEGDFQNLFNAELQGGLKEALFTIDFQGIRDGNYGQDYQAALTGIRGNDAAGIGGGWSVAVPNIKVYETWDGRDYRKAVSLDTIADFDGVIEPFVNFPNYDPRNLASAYIAKYTRLPGLTANGNGRASSFNYAMMRYSEVLLIAAEALNEVSPGSAEAAGYVNRVRARARNHGGVVSNYPMDVASGMSQDEFRDMVIEERKWEFAFEFKRWYDIKRRELGDEVFGPNGLEHRPNFSAARDYLYPLPADELQRNPNLAPNNPGY